MHNKHQISGNAPKNGLERYPNGDSVPEYDDENRIDWDRKQRHKHRDDVTVIGEPVVDDPLLDDLVGVSEKKTGKKDHRKKRRQYIYDEELGQVVVKHRRRKRRLKYGEFGDE